MDKGKNRENKIEMKIEVKMLKVGRTVYFESRRRIKAKTPFAPVFYDISKSKLIILN